MKKIVIKIKLYYQEILIFLAFIFITLIATYPVIFKINNSIYGPLYGTDNLATLWHLWWPKYAWLHHLSAKFIPISASPFGVDFSKIPLSLGCAFFFRWSVILANEIFVFNFVLLLSFFISAVIMYYLVYRFTKNRVASAVSGIIFAFCPYHFNRAWEHFLLAQIQWLPLYALMLLNLWKKPVLKNALFAALAFALVIVFDFSYAYIMSVFTLGFLVFVFLYRWRDKIKCQVQKSTWRVVKMTVMAMLLAMLIHFPTLYSIFKTILFVPKTEAIAIQGYVRPFHYLFTHSARPLSYLLPASAHPIFGNFTKSMFGSIFYGRGSIEQTLYLGWVPIILAFIAFRRWRRTRKLKIEDKDDFIIGFFIFSAIAGFLFSMPPYFNLGIFKIYFPSFFMYKILPMFRAYARFGVLVMLCVSVLAGFGLKYILERIRTTKKRFAFTALVSCLILFEFTNIPPFHVTDISKPPLVYQWIKEQKGDFAIVEYPLGESVGPGESAIPNDYLFYQRVHQKKMINGAQIGTYAYKVKQKISKIMAPQIPGILSWLGARYVIVHLDRYKTSEDLDAMEVLGEVPDLSKQKGLKFVKRFNSVEVYEVIAKPKKPEVVE